MGEKEHNMKKPFVETSLEVLDHIDPSKKVRVYRNLHKKCVSVRQGGIVKCHAVNVVLKDCRFIVSEAGQRRVREEGKKNVHAFVEGYVRSARESLNLLDFGWDSVYYNPYETDHWVLSNRCYDVYVDRAEWVDVWCDEVCGDVLAFNLTYQKAMV
tara:strand:+ start:5260 stop:5727 length:468 start_codon:yes stop_codon:yes gene_type:complete